MEDNTESMISFPEETVEGGPAIAVVGMGYVGLTLASLLAVKGFRIHAVERNHCVADTLSRREVHLIEPGVEQAIQNCMGMNWTVSGEYAFNPDIAVICVSTPVGADGVPDLSDLKDATSSLARRIRENGLVIVRSTVPIGTTRRVVLPLMGSRRVRLAFCPERTIQGQALRELVELPQIVGALNEESLEAAASFFAQLTRRVVRVSSLEAAEMVKLVNNCHTDVIYSFGNEVALMAKENRLDPLEVIDAANVDYPRPDLAKPGFVGGACLSKDPYILFSSFDRKRCLLRLIRAARELNERMPGEVAEHLLNLLGRSGKRATNLRILVCGFAYKGVPETDDIRGTPAIPFVRAVCPSCMEILGHDYVVRDEVIASCGARPVSLAEGFRLSDAAVFLNNHPRYATMDLSSLLASAPRPFVLYDCWRMFRGRPDVTGEGIRYAGIGFEEP